MMSAAFWALRGRPRIRQAAGPSGAWPSVALPPPPSRLMGVAGGALSVLGPMPGLFRPPFRIPEGVPEEIGGVRAERLGQRTVQGGMGPFSGSWQMC